MTSPMDSDPDPNIRTREPTISYEDSVAKSEHHFYLYGVIFIWILCSVAYYFSDVPEWYYLAGLNTIVFGLLALTDGPAVGGTENTVIYYHCPHCGTLLKSTEIPQNNASFLCPNCSRAIRNKF